MKPEPMSTIAASPPRTAKFTMINPDPPVPPRGPTPEETEKIRRRSKWGIHLARIGSRWPFVARGAATNDYGETEDVTHMLEVKDLARFPKVRDRLKCRCLHCDIRTDTREEMEQAHFDRYGNAKAMAAKGISHVWAYECADEWERTERGVDQAAQPMPIKIKEPIGLLSDRSMTDE